MSAEKLSISLEAPLLAFLGQYQETHAVRSKSEVVAQALRLLRERELEAQYAAALHEWQASGEADVWDSAVADGLEADAAR
ncbi:type II toxin-antitoxin system ParD family antitoxin [Deinococcus radiomollis]|uniref:type II toxin-antitoxin system ParD family antitoxin n=1 Tax=Deinococcus radiomollis TaxID=468916 RepID=UPI0038922165